MMKNNHQIDSLLKSGKYSLKKLFPVGKVVKGKVIEMKKEGIFLDLQGMAIGVIRGPELYDESGESLNLKVGDNLTATVIEQENERGEVELSLKAVSHSKIWDRLKKIAEQKEIVKVKVIGANKGGLLIQFGKFSGFLPASQLSTEHYPKVEMGDKNKILKELKKLVNQTLEVVVITADELEKKLVVSEKMVVWEKQKNVLTQYRIGDLVEGKVTALTKFGVFLEFGEKEKIKGLIHISELSWQKVNKIEEFVKLGDKVKAVVIDLDNSKVSLSLKRLLPNPWQKIGEKYKIGQIVSGRISKITPYGLFVELSHKIHGLVHISELPENFLKTTPPLVNEGDVLKLKIISLDPEDHRLGLSLNLS